MAKIIIEFDIDNAAFEDCLPRECEEIFKDIVRGLWYEDKSAFVRDSNGNRIGTWRIENN